MINKLHAGKSVRVAGRGWSSTPIVAVLAAALASSVASSAAAQADEPWAANTPTPQNVRDLLLALKTAESGIPFKIRETLLDRVESIDVAGRGAAPDRYLRANAEGFDIVIRSFEGPTARDTVYLLKSDSELSDCAELERWLGPKDRVGRRFCENDDESGYARIRATGATRFGFAAYRIDAKGRPKNVTNEVFPADPFARLPARERAGVHDEAGRTSGAWVDRSRLSEVPVLRLYLEYGDGHGLPRSHPRAFSGGYAGDLVFKSHLGFLVWNGRRFELREKVTRAFWPCTYDETISASGRSCDPSDPDPFVDAEAASASEPKRSP